MVMYQHHGLASRQREREKCIDLSHLYRYSRIHTHQCCGSGSAGRRVIATGDSDVSSREGSDSPSLSLELKHFSNSF